MSNSVRDRLLPATRVAAVLHICTINPDTQSLGYCRAFGGSYEDTAAEAGRHIAGRDRRIHFSCGGCYSPVAAGSAPLYVRKASAWLVLAYNILMSNPYAILMFRA